jgi:excinuclease ABC subunit A
VASGQFIELEGVRVNNLRNIDLKIRHHALTVICGVSGSGKSSLAFDTLYAEGQRRYVETFSPSARQFLDRIERPTRIESAVCLPPSLSDNKCDSTGLGAH